MLAILFFILALIIIVGFLFAVLHEFNHRETKEKERKDKKRK